MLDIFGNYAYTVRAGLIFVLIAYSLQLTLRAGMFVVPQAGFVAIGAYTSAILTQEHDVPFGVALVVACVATALAGLVLAALLARTDGIYLALASIAFGEIVRITALNLEVTGGPVGLVGIRLATTDGLLVVSTGLCAIFMWRFGASKLGLALDAIRADPLLAAHQGVNLRRWRLSLLTVSGGIAGLGGGLLAHHRGFLEASDFGFGLVEEMLAIVILGGLAYCVGPWLGAVIVYGAPQALSFLEEFRLAMNGVVIVVVVALAPSGLAGIAAGIAKRFRLVGGTTVPSGVDHAREVSTP